MATPDYADPCAMLEYLRPAYYQLLAGERTVSVRFGDREVQYTSAAISDLRDEIQALEIACAEKNGTPQRRFAIRAGSRRF